MSTNKIAESVLEKRQANKKEEINKFLIKKGYEPLTKEESALFSTYYI
jgi:hypothetical protein